MSAFFLDHIRNHIYESYATTGFPRFFVDTSFDPTRFSTRISLYCHCGLNESK